jgi:hypothetical protein
MNEIENTLDSCEWNPKEKREAYSSEFHAKAEISVGYNGRWHLCRNCAKLPEFKRFRIKKLLKY